jgi:hypothetical protein
MHGYEARREREGKKYENINEDEKIFMFEVFFIFIFSYFNLKNLSLRVRLRLSFCFRIDLLPFKNKNIENKKKINEH